MRILIVDDIEKNRTLLERFLKGRGYEVSSAPSGAVALEILNEQAIELVLMDIKMPDMDGFEATRIIKSKNNDQYLPVIFVTALSEEEALEEALAAGGDDFISKPVNLGILLSKIKAHSRIRELHGEVTEKNQQLARHNARLNREHSLISHFFDQAQKNCFVDASVIKSTSVPMSVFNGDTVLVAKRPSGGITVLLGDFTGHGLSAAVGTLPVSQIFFQMIEENAYIGDIARELNRQIGTLLPIEMFFAATLIELSANGDRLMVWHGGMPDAYLLNQETADVTIIRSSHLPLGVRSTDEFDDSVQLYYVNENYKFIAITDGLTEAVNQADEMIDVDLIIQSINNNHDDILNSIINTYQNFSEGVPQADDISLIELNCVEVAGENQSENVKKLQQAIPWQIKVRVEDQEMLNDLAEKVMSLVGYTDVLKEHKGIIHTLISEMYTNAVDHGVLGLHGSEKDSEEAFDAFYAERENRIKKLDGAFIEIELTYGSNGDGSAELVIVMRHNGNTFDVNDKTINDSGLHGRGMDLIEAICDSVIYSDHGRRLTVIYNIASIN